MTPPTFEQAAKKPTAAGLRIGKKYPERDPGEPYDSDDEWDRDGMGGSCRPQRFCTECARPVGGRREHHHVRKR